MNSSISRRPYDPKCQVTWIVLNMVSDFRSNKKYEMDDGYRNVIGASFLYWCFVLIFGTSFLYWCFVPLLVLRSSIGTSFLYWCFVPLLVLRSYIGTSFLYWCFVPILVLRSCIGTSFLY